MLRAVLVTGALAAAAATAYVMLGRGGKGTAGGGGEPEGELLPALTEAETVAIMSSILDKVKMIAMRMVAAAENIKAQLAQQGQEMDDRKLMKTFIYQHFVEQLEQIQSSVLAEADAEEAELEDAVTVYLGMGGNQPELKELREIVQKLKALHFQFGGDAEKAEGAAEATAGEVDGAGGDASGEEQRELALDDLLEVLGTLTDRISDAMDDYIVAFKEENGDPDATNIEQFHHGFMKLTEGIEKQALIEHDVQAMAFQQAIEKNQNSQQLQMAFMRMQMASQAKMVEHGLQM